MPKYLTQDRCLATVVLSNIGKVDTGFTARFSRADGRIVAGNLVLEEISGVPPLRAQTHAVMLVSTYAGIITFSVRCDPQYFTVAEAGEFLSLFMAHLDGSGEI